MLGVLSPRGSTPVFRQRISIAGPSSRCSLSFTKNSRSSAGETRSMIAQSESRSYRFLSARPVSSGRNQREQSMPRVRAVEEAYDVEQYVCV